MKMIKKFFKTKMYVWVFLLVLILIGGSFALGITSGFLKTTSTNTSDSMVKSIEKVSEQVFLNVSIQDVETKTKNTKIPWTDMGIPGTQKKVILILNYNAKLGIRKPVKIIRDSNQEYSINIPKFDVIGIELDKKNPYQMYDQSGELFSIVTKNIDTGKIVTSSLSNKKQESYLEKYQLQLKESAMLFYKNQFKLIDPDLKINFNFE